MQTLEKTKKILIENFIIDEDALKPEASLESLGMDSLDKIDLLFEIEEEFKIKIEPNDIKGNTLREMVDSIDIVISRQHKEENICIENREK